MGLPLLLASAGLLFLALGFVLFLGRRKRPSERLGPAGATVPEGIPSEGGATTPLERSEEDAERARLLALWQHFVRRLR